MLGETRGHLEEVVALGRGVPSVSGRVGRGTSVHFQYEPQMESVGAAASEKLLVWDLAHPGLSLS